MTVDDYPATLIRGAAVRQFCATFFKKHTHLPTYDPKAKLPREKVARWFQQATQEMDLKYRQRTDRGRVVTRGAAVVATVRRDSRSVRAVCLVRRLGGFTVRSTSG